MMWSALSSLVRLALAGCLALVSLAILVSRATPREATPRILEPVRPVAISRSVCRPQSSGTRYYHPDTGRLGLIPLPPSQRLDYASFSPWKDPQGGHQVAGLWMQFTESKAGPILNKMGLARLDVSNGQVLDHVETEVFPIGLPCWFPDGSSRVLFTAADGQLYRHEFDADLADLTRPSIPRPLSWSAGLDVEEISLLSDPCWPNDLRFSRTIIVAMRWKSSDDEVPPSELWWLKLDAQSEQIVAAGRLTTPAEGNRQAASELSPVITNLPDGAGLLLAYLSVDQGNFWRLHVTPLEIDPNTGTPQASTTQGLPLNAYARPDVPAFSSDGRVVTCMVLNARNEVQCVQQTLNDFGITAPDYARPALATLGYPPCPSP